MSAPLPWSDRRAWKGRVDSGLDCASNGEPSSSKPVIVETIEGAFIIGVCAAKRAGRRWVDAHDVQTVSLVTGGAPLRARVEGYRIAAASVVADQRESLFEPGNGSPRCTGALLVCSRPRRRDEQKARVVAEPRARRERAGSEA